MKEQRNIIVGLFFCACFFFTGCLQAQTSVFLEQGTLKGAVETAGEIGRVQSLETALVTGDSANQIIIAGRLSNKYITPLVQASGLEVDTNWIGEQGFYIKSLEDDSILITADTHTGVLYGLMELRDRIEDDGRGVLKQKLNIKDRPVFDVRLGSAQKRANFTTFWATEPDGPSYKDATLFLYEGFPEIFPNDDVRTEHIQKVKARREKLKKAIAKAADYGARVYLFMYEPALPYWAKEPFIAAHPEVKVKRRDKWWEPFMCPCQQTSKRLLSVKMKNLFRDVPDIGGILLNIGEKNQSIFSCGCEKCQTQPYKDRLVEYLLLIRKAMLDGSGKDPNADPDAPKIYLRPWSIVKHGLGSKEEEFSTLAEILPKDICFWSKVTVPPGGDYLWNDHFSPFVNMPRMETFGWDTHHPNLSLPCPAQLCYTGPKLKARAMKLAKLGMRGQAPCRKPKKDEVLYEPSRLATSKIAWDPFRFDPDKFLLEWAEKRFGKEASPYVADALKDTYKITDAFTILPTNTNWFHLMNFVPDKKTHCYSGTNSAKQTKDIANTNKQTLKKVLSKFELAEEVKIAESAEENLAKALTINPENKALKRFWMMSKATVGLTKFYHHYHFALVYNNASKTVNGRDSRKYYELAAGHIKKAVPEMEAYLAWMYKIHPKFLTFFDVDTNPFVGYIFGQLASVSQQCQNAYNRLVMEPLRAEKYPYLLWEAENADKKIGYKRYAPWPVETRWKSIHSKLLEKWNSQEFIFDANAGADKPQSLPAIISPDILPKLRVKFSGDLSSGGMLVLRFVPLGPKGRVGARPRKSLLKISLNGQDITTLDDIATNDTMEDNEYIRYVELPATDKAGKHELTFVSMPDCTGTEIYFMRLYTPKEQKIYKHKSHTSLNLFEEKLDTPLWSFEY
ncbi:MAG: hypothetical protein K8R02_06235 [Anaerohalosphaeraceae bacterium]|nr:hypothetical protein [Anaerohalosphaeraceae bacterium]